MLYAIFGGFFLLLQLFLLVNTRINIFPELFFFPWLVSKGLMPYRDFFDHHGFLLYYIFAPLTSNISLIFIKLFFIFFQSINLILLLFLLKKYSNKFGFILGGLTYVALNFFIADNNVWYEVFITFFYLLIFITIFTNFKYKNWILGILIALSSFIKPTAAVLLIPVLYIGQSLVPLISFFSSWSVVVFIFWINRGLLQLISDLFLFNALYSGNYHDSYFSNTEMLKRTVLILFICVVFNGIRKKSKQVLPTVLFLVSGVVFIFYQFAKFHFVPMVPFIVLLIMQSIKHMRGVLKTTLIVLVLFYVVYLGRQTKFQYYYLKKQPEWIRSSITDKIISHLKNNNLIDKNLYVFGNRGEVYYFLDKIPPTNYPLIFLMMDKYIPDLQTKIIEDLRHTNVKVIVLQKPIDRQHEELFKLKEYIYKNYRLSKKEKDFEIYVQ